jgi:hypothetical protein
LIPEVAIASRNFTGMVRRTEVAADDNVAPAGSVASSSKAFRALGGVCESTVSNPYYLAALCELSIWAVQLGISEAGNNSYNFERIDRD